MLFKFKIKKLVSLFAALIIFIFLEILFKAPSFLYWIWPLLLVLVVVSILFLIGKDIYLHKDNLNFFITPILFLVGGISFIIFLEAQPFKHFLAILLSVLIWLFLETLFVRLYPAFCKSPVVLPGGGFASNSISSAAESNALWPGKGGYSVKKYPKYSLQNISNYINLISIFFFHSSLFALQIFLNIAIWLLVLASFLFTSLLVYQTFWINSFSLKKNWLYVLAIGYIILEIFWVNIFLPISFFTKSMILSAFYYLFVGLSLNHLLKNLDRQVIKKYLIISLVIIVLALATARWA